MSIYYDWRLEDFSHLQMLLAFPYLIFKFRSAIRKVGLYTRERICCCLEFYKHSYSILLLLSADFYNLAPRGVKKSDTI